MSKQKVNAPSVLKLMKNKVKTRMATEKYFKNPFPDYTPQLASTLIDKQKPSRNSKIVSTLEQKWKITLETLEKIDGRDTSVYTGAAGVALLKFKQDPDNPQVLREVLDLLHLSGLRNKRQTFLCGDAGGIALGIIVHKKLGDDLAANDLIKRLESMQDAVTDVNSDLPNEYLYGRAGYLYALLFVNKYMNPSPIDGTLIRNVIEAILTCGKTESRSHGFKSPLMYQWHGSHYLGAAHGITGIIYLLLHCTEYLLEAEINALIKPTIDYLCTLRFESGNFPSSLGREEDKYVQWCHGAPGFLYMFSKAYKVFGNPAYLELALLCGEVVWTRGLLRKGYSICHGVSGNGYCFLELYQTTKDEKHLYRAIRFAEWCLEYTKMHEENFPDRPFSLYEGIAGPMYFLLDIQNPMEAKFPGFTL